MTKRILNCPDVTLNATALLPEFNEKKDVAMIHTILNFWKKKCWSNQPLHTFKTLFFIQERIFHEDSV